MGKKTRTTSQSHYATEPKLTVKPVTFHCKSNTHALAPTCQPFSQWFQKLQPLETDGVAFFRQTSFLTTIRVTAKGKQTHRRERDMYEGT